MKTTQQNQNVLEKPKLRYKGQTPWTWFFDKLLQKYWSAELYSKFLNGGYKLTQDIKNEWKKDYMEGVGCDYKDRYYAWALSLEDEYKILFKRRKWVLRYITFMLYMSTIAAPKFHEQLSEESKSGITIIN